MSGLLALLDDVAAIAKVAAASVDDVFGQAAKASAKAAGAVIDDAAVTPKYVHGFEANRELPIIWRITKGSLKNKLVYLLPAGLLLSNFAPWAIPPLLMLGGAYLCFEGAEKIAHALGVGGAGHVDHPGKGAVIEDPAHLEEQKAAGAIKTDLILSAEIMTIVLSNLEVSNAWMEAGALAAAAVIITAAVYGSVALIVKMDDLGLHLSKKESAGAQSFGNFLLKAMPFLLKALSFIGTIAMLWVGGGILLHAMHEFGFDPIYDAAHGLEYAVKNATGGLGGLLGWLTFAALSALLALGVGAVIAFLLHKVFKMGHGFGKEAEAH